MLLYIGKNTAPLSVRRNTSMSQSQSRFCTNCGQSMGPSTAFCTHCGTSVSGSSTAKPGQFSADATPGYPFPNAQAPSQMQDDLLLAASAFASRRELRRARRVSRGPGARLRSYGCILLIMASLVGPFVGVALTTGIPHEIFKYVTIGIAVVLILLLLLSMLFTRGGREALRDSLIEELLKALFDGR